MFNHIQRITSVAVVGPATLHIAFADGVERLVDLTAVLRGALYEPLRDPAEFARVQVDAECGALVWPSGADFDPGTLHDWPDAGAKMAELAARW